MGRFLTYLFLVIIALGAGFYFYQRNITAIPVTTADIEKGGSFSAAERAALVSACTTRTKQDGETICGCIADKAGTELSRFDRIVMTASFEQKLSGIVAAGKGLVASGIPAEKIKTAEDGSKVRMKDIMKTCNLPE
ncbi:MAG: hypothetical protein ABL901_16125 [Hyphomicrobiaceae bacterium]